MLQFNAPTRVAFVSSYPPGSCPIAAFSSHITESVVSASYGSIEPVTIALHSDVSREYPEDVNFVIRRDFRSDYIEAADFIHAGYGDVVVAQHTFDLYGGPGGAFFIDFLKQVDVPVITTLHDISPHLPGCHWQGLIEISRMSAKLLVRDKHSYELLTKQCTIGRDKIDLINSEKPDYLFDQPTKWFHVGRHYWGLVNEQLHRYAGNVRSLQAEKEHALLFEQ